MNATVHDLDSDPTVKLFRKTLQYLSAMSPEAFRVSTEAVADGSLSSRVGLLADSSVIASPAIVGNQIMFELNFLRFLWICTYTVLVTTNSIMRRETSKTWAGDMFSLLEEQEFLDAFYLFQKALTQRPGAVALSPWLPDPDTAEKTVQAANACFHIAIGFILLHEIGHSTLGHPALDKSENLQYEKEADTFALEVLLGNAVDERQRRLFGIGIANSFYASIFLLTSIKQLNQVHHPDVDHRLMHVLDGLNIKDESIGYYLKRMTTIALDLFLTRYGVSDYPNKFETVDQALEAYWLLLDKLKEAGAF